MVSHHQMSKSAVPVFSARLPAAGLNWVVFLQVCLGFCSRQGTHITCLISSLCCFFSLSPLMEACFLCRSDALFSYLIKHKSKTKLNIHISPHLLFYFFMFHSRPSLFKKSCLRIWSPLSYLPFSPEYVKYTHSLRRNSKQPCAPHLALWIDHSSSLTPTVAPLWLRLLLSLRGNHYPKFSLHHSLVCITILHCLVLPLFKFM